MAKTAVEHVFGNTLAPMSSIGAPTGLSVAQFGTPGVTTYTYYITAYNTTGETLATSIVTTTGNATLNSSNFNRITWLKILGATGYKIYTNSTSLLATTSNLHYDDIGGSTSASTLPVSDTSGYNSNYASVGSLMYQTSGAIGPMPVKIARPLQESTAFQCNLVHVEKWSPTIDWVFLAEGSAAAATRRIHLYEFNRSTNAFTWKGYITITFPTATNHTIRGLETTYDIYSTGTVAVSTTSVTGTGTSWSTNRICVGSRIGFGSTDPNQIGTWYEISAVGGDTSITLTGSAGTIGANSVYCIEDLRAYITTTNATPANGGLFVAKGLRYELWVSGGTTISAATTTDNLRLVYWLADASTVLNTTALGITTDDKTSWTNQDVYVLDGTSSVKVYKYNVRASLSGLASGKSTSAFSYSTGVQVVTGTAAQNNNGEMATTLHGPGLSKKCIYFVTTTRVYRAELTNIVNGSTVWISDCIPEIPPGGINTFPLTSALGALDYSIVNDRFLIWSTGATSFRSYATRYLGFQSPFDSIIAVESKQMGGTGADANSAPHPQIALSQLVSYTQDGITYVLRQNSSNNFNQLYAVPYSACYTHGQEQCVITSAIPTPNDATVYRIYVNTMLAHGSTDTFYIAPEPIKIFYRVSGIIDNSGQWWLLPDNGIVSGVSTGQDIQIKICFKVFGLFSLPSKVYSATVVYESDTDLPAHLQWNMGDTSTTDGTVGFIQKTTYGSVPNLQISYYRTDTDELVLTQASTGSNYGVFEYWNGSSWASGLDSDTIGKRRRFRPTTGILTGVNVYCKLKTI